MISDMPLLMLAIADTLAILIISAFRPPTFSPFTPLHDAAISPPCR
jgi:hypothetical protein